MSYLDVYIEETKKELAAASAREEPMDKTKRARYLECMKRKGQVMNAIQGGDMSIEDYTGTLNLIKGKDEKLIPFFTAKGQKANAKYCRDRLKCIEEELADD